VRSAAGTLPTVVGSPYELQAEKAKALHQELTCSRLKKNTQANGVQHWLVGGGRHHTCTGTGGIASNSPRQ
jgi:hypothetical protein